MPNGIVSKRDLPPLQPFGLENIRQNHDPWTSSRMVEPLVVGRMQHDPWHHWPLSRSPTLREGRARTIGTKAKSSSRGRAFWAGCPAVRSRPCKPRTGTSCSGLCLEVVPLAVVNGCHLRWILILFPHTWTHNSKHPKIHKSIEFNHQVVSSIPSPQEKVITCSPSPRHPGIFHPSPAQLWSPRRKRTTLPVERSSGITRGRGGATTWNAPCRPYR